MKIFNGRKFNGKIELKCNEGRGRGEVKHFSVEHANQNPSDSADKITR